MIDHADNTTALVPQKMDPEAKTTWLEALRSGNFEQTTSKLQDEKGCNCCLGVLARVQDIKFKSSVYGQSFNFGEVVDHEGDYISNYCPPDGFCGISPDVQEHLVNMNDVEKKSFDEIADYIEANL